MKRKREFLRELYGNHIKEIPFYWYFQDDRYLRSELFVEYLQTKAKPNFSLYLSSYYSSNELENGWAETENNMPVSDSKNTTAGFVKNTEFENKVLELQAQFDNLVVKRELPEMYFSHSIIETKIVQTLKLVWQEIKDFEHFVLSATFYNPNEYAINFAESIIAKLEDMALPELKNAILNYFRGDRINLTLESYFILENLVPRSLPANKISKEEAGRKYRELKMYADVYINDYLWSISIKEDELFISKPTKEEDVLEVKEILKPLSGYWNKNLILNKSDFTNLIEYTLHIMENDCLPNETVQFPNTGASVEFIRKTIHLVYLYLNKKNKDSFVSLIHLFKQLDKTEKTTTFTKFSVYTGNYRNDARTMITYQR